MAKFFNASELAQAAVQIERRGQQFYAQAAAKVASDDVRSFFANFVEEEAAHERLFQALADRLGQAPLPAWSTQDEYGDYLDALLDSHSLFGEGSVDDALRQVADQASAIRMAMNFEKDTLLFFTEMKDLVPDNEKKFVQECIDEERTHLRMLKAKMDSL